MRANVWSGRNTVQVENVPDPKILNDRDAIVRIMPLGEAPNGYETFKHKQDECVKVVLEPQT